MTKPVVVELSAIPEKFLEKGIKASQGEPVGCLYPYLETKKLLDGSNAFYPRVIGERDPNDPFSWRWGYSINSQLTIRNSQLSPYNGCNAKIWGL